MRAVILLIIVATLVYSRDVNSGHECDCDDGDHNEAIQEEFRELTQILNTKINNLVAKTNYIETKLEDGQLGKEKETRVRNLLRRAQSVKGNTCGENFFSCLDAENTCVSKFLVCDKHKDCPNGLDEDENTCHNPLDVGSQWKGIVFFDHCTESRPQKGDLTVIETEHDHMFPSIVNMKLMVVITNVHPGYTTFKSNVEFRCRYFYGGRNLVCNDFEGLGVGGYFLPGNDDLFSMYGSRKSPTGWGVSCVKVDYKKVIE